MNWPDLLESTIAMYCIILGRYFVICGAFYWYLWLRDPSRVRALKLTDIRPEKALIRREIKWSAVSSIIYAIPGAIVIEAWKAGGTMMYTDVAQYGWLYLLFSMFVYLFVQDTYFYWTHRLMHHPRLFGILHKVHHDSRQPTPWAAFSFHPYESIISVVVLPLLTFIVPIHVGAVLFILTLMTFCSVLNHTGFEMLPLRWVRGFFGRHFISAAHHNLHHQKYLLNYGLYFRFWDKLMGTDRFEGMYEFLDGPVSAAADAEARS